MPVEAPVSLSDTILALTPHMSEDDLLRIIYARIEKGVKFTGDDFVQPGHIAHRLAQSFARTYDGTFEFMVSMKENAKYGRLKTYHTAGVVNSWYAEVVRIQIRERREAPQSFRQDQPIGIPPPSKESPPVDSEGVVAINAVVPDGYYTLVFSDDSHLTLRVLVHPTDPGTQKIAALRGPNNESDYQPFGFFKGSRYIPFSAFREGYDRWHWAAKAIIALTPEERKECGVLYAKESTRCYKCGRLLTDPLSITLGIGPTCRGDE